MDSQHPNPTTLIEKALDNKADDIQLESSFTALDKHPQAELIRQKLIDENKQVWWFMAMNLSESVLKNEETPMPVTLKEMTNTAQFYRLDVHLRALDIAKNGSPLGVLVTNQRFCISDPKQMESLILSRLSGSKLIAVKQFENNTLRVFQADTISLRDSQNNCPPNTTLNISNLKKMVVSPNGKWMFLTFYNSGPDLVYLNNQNTIEQRHSLTKNTKITAFSINENNEYGIYTTQDEAGTLKITSEGIQFKKFVSDCPDPLCVDITHYGTYGLIVSEKLIERIEPKLLFETGQSPSTNIPLELVTHARLSPCGDYVFAVHSNGEISIVNLQNSTMSQHIFPNQILTEIALNPFGSSIVFGGQSCLVKATISPILEKLRTTSLSNIATLIQMWRKKETIKESTFLKNRFLQMIFPNRRTLLKLSKLTLEELNLSECPICYDEIADSTTACKHTFCCSCLEQRIKDKPECPICRTSLTTNTP